MFLISPRTEAQCDQHHARDPVTQTRQQRPATDASRRNHDGCRFHSAFALRASACSTGRPQSDISLAWPEEAQRRQRRQIGQHVEIAFDVFLDMGALHLDNHAHAIVQLRGIGLADGGRRARHRLERREDFFRRRAQFARDDLRDGVVRNPRHGVLQFGKFGDVRRRQQVGARAQNLTKLDEGHAEVLARHAKMLGLRVRRLTGWMTEQSALKRHEVAGPSCITTQPNPCRARIVAISR